MPSNKVSPTLQGCRIALTVAADDPDTPSAHLIDLEGEVLFYPVAQVLPPDTYDGLDTALKRCLAGEIDWLLLTTPCAVEAVAQRLAAREIAPTSLTDIKIALYGAKTRLTAESLFPTWQSALPHINTHEQLVEAMQLGAEETVVIPLPLRSRSDWSRLLRATGAETLAVPAYRLLLGRGGDDLPSLLWGGLVDAVVFLTENSVRHFAIRLKVEGGSLDMLGHVVVACLDPQTAAAAQAFDLQVQVVPNNYTAEALAESLAQYFSTESVSPVNA